MGQCHLQGTAGNPECACGRPRHAHAAVLSGPESRRARGGRRALSPFPPVERKPGGRGSGHEPVAGHADQDGPAEGQRTRGVCQPCGSALCQRGDEMTAAEMVLERPGAATQGSAQRIEIDNVSLRYFTRQAEILALSGISLSIEPGEFVSLIGQSGCGKSTLLSIIAGILPPSDGEVRVGGRRVTAPSPRIGYMLQQDYLFEWRTILDNALLGAEIQKRDMNEARDRAVRLLEKCGMGNFLDQYPRALSGGMRQRVALARTLTTNPDVVLLDEPFSALDSQTRLAIADEVVDVLRSEGKSVVLVTHDIGEAISMTDRVVVLSRRPGRIKSQHAISFPSVAGRRPTPFEARGLPEFNAYFNTLWDELDVHVEG